MISIAKWKISTTIFCLSILLIAMMGYFRVGFSIIHFLLFLLYIVVYVYLPGKILYKNLKINLSGNMMEEIIAFYLGIFLIILQYFVLSYLGIRIAIKFISPILILVVLMYRGLKGQKLVNFDSIPFRTDTVTTLLISLNMLLSAGMTLFLYPRPDVIPNATIKPDIAWHMGNVNILSGINHNMDYRVDGVKFVYHYFSDLFYAVCKYIFGISAYELIVQFQFIIIGILVTASIIAFFHKLLTKRWLVIIASLSFMYAPTLFSRFFNTIFHHLFTNVNSMALALPALLILIILVKEMLEGRVNKGSYFLLFVFVFLLAGLKGPIALAFILSMYLFTVLLIFQKEVNQSWILGLFGCTIAYLIIHFTLLNQGAELVEVNVKSAFDVVTRSLFHLGRRESYWGTILLVIPHFIVVASFFSITYLIALFRSVFGLFRKEKIPLFKQFCFIFSILCMGAYYIIRHSGFSQMYFLFGALPIIYYLGGNELEGLKRDKITLKRAVMLLFLMFTIIALKDTFQSIRQNTRQIVYNVNHSMERKENAISHFEYEGLMWIKQNTNKRDLMATNRHNANNRFFLYSGYSDRKFYIEGYDYSQNSGLELSRAESMLYKNDLLFSSDFPIKNEVALDLKIDYVILYKHEKRNALPKGESGFQLRFDNEDISVYQVIKQEKTLGFNYSESK